MAMIVREIREQVVREMQESHGPNAQIPDWSETQVMTETNLLGSPPRRVLSERELRQRGTGLSVTVCGGAGGAGRTRRLRRRATPTISCRPFACRQCQDASWRDRWVPMGAGREHVASRRSACARAGAAHTSAWLGAHVRAHGGERARGVMTHPDRSMTLTLGPHVTGVNHYLYPTLRARTLRGLTLRARLPTVV